MAQTNDMKWASIPLSIPTLLSDTPRDQLRKVSPSHPPPRRRAACSIASFPACRSACSNAFFPACRRACLLHGLPACVACLPALPPPAQALPPLPGAAAHDGACKAEREAARACSASSNLRCTGRCRHSSSDRYARVGATAATTAATARLTGLSHPQVLFQQECIATHKFDGTNVGVDERGLLYGRNQTIPPTAGA